MEEYTLYGTNYQQLLEYLEDTDIQITETCGSYILSCPTNYSHGIKMRVLLGRIRGMPPDNLNQGDYARIYLKALSYNNSCKLLGYATPTYQPETVISRILQHLQHIGVDAKVQIGTT